MEAKATCVRGHVHRINGLDRLDSSADGRLLLFSLRMREGATASNAFLSLIETITTAIGDDRQALDGFESRLVQTGDSPLTANRDAELRFRVINERLHEAGGSFPRLSEALFVGGLPSGVKRVDHEVSPDAMIVMSPTAFEPPGSLAD